jgi:hypothetical protein
LDRFENVVFSGQAVAERRRRERYARELVSQGRDRETASAVVAMRNLDMVAA